MQTLDERKDVLKQKANKCQRAYEAIGKVEQPFVLHFMFGFFSPELQSSDKIHYAERFWDVLASSLMTFPKGKEALGEEKGN